MNYPSVQAALQELSKQVPDESIVYVHRPHDSEREHIMGPDCWCNPVPLSGKELRGYYDASL